MILFAKNLLFTLIVPGTVAVYLPFLLVQGLAAGCNGILAAALALFAAGGAIYAWCVWDFASFGRGTPAPIDAPKKLVVRGLYRYSRNPMYLGVLTVILGWAVLYRSPTLVLYALVVGSGFQLFIVLYEERHLLREFGSEYEAYCAGVSRWLPRAPWRRSP